MILPNLLASTRLLGLYALLASATIQPGQVPPDTQQPMGGTVQPGQAIQPDGSSSGATQPGGGSGGSKSGSSAGGYTPGSTPDADESVRTLPGYYNGYASNNTPDCPGADLKTYEAPGGYFFMIQCSRRVMTVYFAKHTGLTFQQCLDKCADEPTCFSLDYMIAGRDCYLKEASTIANDNTDVLIDYNYASKIDPPTFQQSSDRIQRCSTKCPDADGQTYDTIFGETYRMFCGRRHATPYIKVDKQANLTECIDACAGFSSCSSVDYHETSKLCYYSDHRGQPAVTTETYSSAYSIGCAGACSGGGTCGNLADKSKRPVVPQPKGIPDLSCGNAGLEYAVYASTLSNTSNVGQGDVNQFTGTNFKTNWPILNSGKIFNPGFTDTRKDIYGYAPQQGTNIAVNHKGYIYAPKAGTYTISLPSCDDIVLVWFGALAQNGWTRQNANLVAVYRGTPPSTTYQAKEGEYIPIRIMYGNIGGIGNFQMKVTDPDGKTLIDSTAKFQSQYMVRYSCDETTAPRMRPFGAER